MGIFGNPNVGGRKSVGSAAAASAASKAQQYIKGMQDASSYVSKLNPDIQDAIKSYLYGQGDQTLARTYGGSTTQVPNALAKYNLPVNVYNALASDKQTYSDQKSKGFAKADSYLFGSMDFAPAPTTTAPTANATGTPTTGVNTQNVAGATGNVSPVLGGSGSPIGNILAQGIPGGGGTPQTAQEALEQANNANNARYLQGLGLYDAQYANLEGVGASGKTRIDEAYNRASANRTQDLISRGLYGTSTGLNYERALNSDRERSYQDLYESLAGARNNVLSGAAGFIERRSDVAPDLGMFAQLTSDAAASPTGGNSAGLTWAATGLPVSANDPYQSQINSIVKDVQQRSQQTYDPVQAAKDQIAIEQAVTAARAQADAAAKAQAIRDQKKLEAKNRNLYGVNPETRQPFTSASEKADYFTARNAQKASAKKPSPSSPSYVNYMLGDF